MVFLPQQSFFYSQQENITFFPPDQKQTFFPEMS